MLAHPDHLHLASEALLLASAGWVIRASPPSSASAARKPGNMIYRTRGKFSRTLQEEGPLELSCHLTVPRPLTLPPSSGGDEKLVCFNPVPKGGHRHGPHAQSLFCFSSGSSKQAPHQGGENPHLSLLGPKLTKIWLRGG